MAVDVVGPVPVVARLYWQAVSSFVEPAIAVEDRYHLAPVKRQRRTVASRADIVADRQNKEQRAIEVIAPPVAGSQVLLLDPRIRLPHLFPFLGLGWPRQNDAARSLSVRLHTTREKIDLSPHCSLVHAQAAPEASNNHHDNRFVLGRYRPDRPQGRQSCRAHPSGCWKGPHAGSARSCCASAGQPPASHRNGSHRHSPRRSVLPGPDRKPSELHRASRRRSRKCPSGLCSAITTPHPVRAILRPR